MSIAAALILAATASGAPAAEAPVRSQPIAPVAQARASVRILSAETIRFDRAGQMEAARVAVRRDDAGTTWIEFH